MPEANRELLSKAERQHPRDAGVADCWRLVTRGIELGWLDVGELRELSDYLRDHRDWGAEELLFANLGDELRVSLLDDEAVCAGASLVDEVAALLASVDNLPPA
jgi:hypothetical protein